jgi:hypothetical protein
MTVSTTSEKLNLKGVVYPDVKNTSKNTDPIIGGHFKTGHLVFPDTIFKEQFMNMLLLMIFIAFFLFLLFL